MTTYTERLAKQVSLSEGDTDIQIRELLSALTGLSTDYIADTNLKNCISYLNNAYANTPILANQTLDDMLKAGDNYINNRLYDTPNYLLFVVMDDENYSSTVYLVDYDKLKAFDEKYIR